MKPGSWPNTCLSSAIKMRTHLKGCLPPISQGQPQSKGGRFPADRRLPLMQVALRKSPDLCNALEMLKCLYRRQAASKINASAQNCDTAPYEHAATSTGGRRQKAPVAPFLWGPGCKQQLAQSASRSEVHHPKERVHQRGFSTSRDVVKHCVLLKGLYAVTAKTKNGAKLRVPPRIYSGYLCNNCAIRPISS